MELTGTIKKIGDIQTFASGFQKREMVIVTEEQYPQPIAIEFLKEKGDALDSFKEGEKVKVSINIGGREWINPQGEAKYFNSITGWRIEKAGDFVDATVNHAKNAAKNPTASASTFNLQEEDDDLPF